MQGAFFISHTPAQNKYGPDYGLEAIRRLEAGYPIVYVRNGIHTQEYPDGRCFEIAVNADGTIREVRELAPALRYGQAAQPATDSDSSR